MYALQIKILVTDALQGLTQVKESIQEVDKEEISNL